MQKPATEHKPNHEAPPPSEWLKLSPVPNGAGSARVVVPDGAKWVVIGEPRLRAIDIVTTDALRALDIAECAPGVHLRLLGDHWPDRINMPATGGGGMLHGRCVAMPLALHITGLVHTINLAWQDDGVWRAVLARARHGMPPLLGGFVGRPDLWTAVSDIAVLTGGPIANDTIDAAERGLLVLHVVGPETGRQLKVYGPLTHLSLQGTRTRSLQADTIRYLRAEGCERLFEVVAEGSHCTVSGGCLMRQLRLAGRWTTAVVSAVAVSRLVTTGIDTLQLRDVPNLTHVTTLGSGATGEPTMRTIVDGAHAPQVEGAGTVTVRPMKADDVHAAFSDPDSAATDGMLQWVRTCQRPGETWLALTVLSVAVDAGRGAAEAWAIRCALLHRTSWLARRGASGGQSASEPNGSAPAWAWAFPRDLADRGWTADLALWLRCVAAKEPTAITYVRVMARACGPDQIRALVHHAAQYVEDSRERGLLLRVATRCMKHGLETELRLDLTTSDGQPESALSPGEVTLLQRTANDLLHGLNGSSKFRAPSSIFAEYIGCCAPTEDGIGLLGQLRLADVQGVERLLLAVQADLGQRPELSPEARQRLSAAVTRQLLVRHRAAEKPTGQQSPFTPP